MYNFQFKYDTIKKTKEILEKKVQKDIALLEKEITEEQTYKKAVAVELTESFSEFTNSTKVLNLKRIIEYQDNLRKKIILSDKKIFALENEKESLLKELIKRSQETKIFNKLEELYFENFKKEEDAKEEKIMNEFGIQSFARSHS